MLRRSLLALCVASGCVTAQAETFDLDFSGQKAVEQSADLNGATVKFRAYENIVYVANPQDKAQQSLSVYVPEAYFEDKEIDGWNKNTAPIFLPNSVGGYMPSQIEKPGIDKRSQSANSLLVALSKGYVVVSPATRGRTSDSGKAPAVIVDLKAAVRYLKANDKLMAGDADKIISNGTSAGGAMSALLGASGDSKDYESYLNALGAAKASDRIFAVSAYCPIHNLENADTAYEWQFNGVNSYQKMQKTDQIDFHAERKTETAQLSGEQIKLSNQLKPMFPGYVNSLKLKDENGNPLTLDSNGNGSFKQYVASFLAKSAQSRLDAGKDLSDRNWLTVKNGKVTAVDFTKYAVAATRLKTPPAFDGVDLSTGENQLFGTKTIDKQHFTDFSEQHSTIPDATRADKQIVYIMNPINYVDTSPVRHWRIRVGSMDRDTSLAIPTILAVKLQNAGKNVDFAMSWDVPHSGDYDLEELFSWIKTITSKK